MFALCVCFWGVKRDDQNQHKRIQKELGLLIKKKHRG